MVKRPTVASLKKVNAENLTSLGAERLAEILVDVAETRPELKRRLRMELAAEQGAEHLLIEIDKRLAALSTSRSKISWRQRPAFIRDLDALRGLIVDRLTALDASGAADRLLVFLRTARQVHGRLRDKEGRVAAVFQQASGDLGRALAAEGERAVGQVVSAIAADPASWREWAPAFVGQVSRDFAEATLVGLSARADASTAWLPVIRAFADAAANPLAFISTYTAQQLRTPAVAAEAARRLLEIGDATAAGAILEGAAPSRGSWGKGKAKAGDIDFDWETQWIEYLEQSGRPEEAQSQRWISFERTLAVERARAFTRRLPDFDDVEAESRAFAYAAHHPDFAAGLAFLMAWPAVSEAAQMILARRGEITAAPEDAEAWAAKVRLRYPDAAHALLRKAAADAFRRRDFATCDRLTADAESIALAGG